MPANAWRIDNGRTVIPLHLEANGSLFIVLKTSTTQQQSNNGENHLVTHPVQTITSHWTVSFNKNLGGPSQPVTFSELSDWSKHQDSAIRYYSGTASYLNTFNWNTAIDTSKQVFLNLGSVSNIAEVFINNISCGYAWTPPYRVNITKSFRPGTTSSQPLRARVTLRVAEVFPLASKARWCL